MANEKYIETIELLRGCKHCGNKPNLSTMAVDYRTSFTFCCCRLSKSARTVELAATHWNNGNIDSKVVYKKNNITKQWERFKSEG